MPNEERLDLQVRVEIHVDEPYVDAIDQPLLEHVARTVLSGEGLRGVLEVGVRISNNAALQELNRDFRGVDAPTDVLSFAADEGEEDLEPFILPPEEEEEEAARYLGDLAISYERVVSQAAEYGHSRRRELCYLLTHGLLHLLGYDHEEQAEAAEMREHEERYMAELGLTREAEPPEELA